MYGADYRTDLNPVFSSPEGYYIRPHTVTKAVRRVATKAGFAAPERWRAAARSLKGSSSKMGAAGLLS